MSERSESAYVVLKEANRFNIYDASGEWLLGNFTEPEAKDLGYEFLKATGDNRITALEAERDELKKRVGELELKWSGTQSDDMVEEHKNLSAKIDNLQQQLHQSEQFRKELVEALEAVKAACKAEPTMNNHKYDQLGIQVNNALATAQALDKTLNGYPTNSPMFGKLTHEQLYDYARQCEVKIGQLQKKLAEARKDGERLDIAKKYAGDIDIKLKPIKGLMMSDTWICDGDNLRSALDKLGQAIDAAMNHKPEGESEG